MIFHMPIIRPAGFWFRLWMRIAGTKSRVECPLLTRAQLKEDPMVMYRWRKYVYMADARHWP